MTPRRRFAKHQRLADQLPVRLSNGVVIGKLTIPCGVCDTPIASDYVRGEVLPCAGGGYRVKGISLCTSCNRYVLTNMLILPQGTTWTTHAPATYPLKYPWPEDAHSDDRVALVHRTGEDWWVALMNRVRAG
jgi:hypothetical protein